MGFIGGWVGALGYDLARDIERLPCEARNDPALLVFVRGPGARPSGALCRVPGRTGVRDRELLARALSPCPRHRRRGATDQGHHRETITGRLKPELQRVDLLRACWPPGSMTGAPKIKAMEIIEALEPTRRGWYAGSIGYLDIGGNMDLSVVSEPAAEWAEPSPRACDSPRPWTAGSRPPRASDCASAAPTRR
jgi:hypothetical protein